MTRGCLSELGLNFSLKRRSTKPSNGYMEGYIMRSMFVFDYGARTVLANGCCSRFTGWVKRSRGCSWEVELMSDALHDKLKNGDSKMVCSWRV